MLEVSPKTKNKFLILGRIWVDAEDFAVTRVEGQPAKNPSFWIHNVHVVQKYGRTGQVLVARAETSRSADARIFGTTDLSIEYFDYVPSVRGAQSQTASGTQGWKQ